MVALCLRGGGMVLDWGNSFGFVFAFCVQQLCYKEVAIVFVIVLGCSYTKVYLCNI